MKQTTSSLLFIIFWVIAGIDIIAAGTGNLQLHTITKPLIVLSLLAALLSSGWRYPKRMLVFAALVFSLTGDVLLLLEKHRALFFAAGLASFLLAHILYILFFFSIRLAQRSVLKKYPAIVMLVAIYVLFFLWLLIPSLGALKIPVIIYALVLGSMLLTAIHVYSDANAGGKLLIAGALFFVVSDSLLAIDKFYTPVAHAGVYIMFTYAMAQFLLVKGFIKMKPHRNFA
jgi:uncharacterized membrane protein YhhN